MVKYPHIKVQLTGEDGNAFAIVARVARAIEQLIDYDASQAFCEEAYATESYPELLTVVASTVHVL